MDFLCVLAVYNEEFKYKTEFLAQMLPILEGALKLGTELFDYKFPQALQVPLLYFPSAKLP